MVRELKLRKSLVRSSPGSGGDEEVKLYQQAREEILEEEIEEGLIILDNIKSEFFEQLDKCAEKPVVDKQEGCFSEESTLAGKERKRKEEEQWLGSLKALHRRIRKSTAFNYPGVLEWLERFLDAIEIV